jgi:hypothetical protein
MTSAVKCIDAIGAPLERGVVPCCVHPSGQDRPGGDSAECNVVTGLVVCRSKDLHAFGGFSGSGPDSRSSSGTSRSRTAYFIAARRGTGQGWPVSHVQQRKPAILGGTFGGTSETRQCRTPAFIRVSEDDSEVSLPPMSSIRLASRICRARHKNQQTCSALGNDRMARTQVMERIEVIRAFAFASPFRP